MAQSKITVPGHLRERKDILDWAVLHRPPLAAPLPWQQLKYKCGQHEYTVSQLAVMDTGASEPMGVIKVLAGGRVKQADSPRADQEEKKRCAVFLIDVAGGYKSMHQAIAKITADKSLEEAETLRRLSLDSCTDKFLACVVDSTDCESQDTSWN